MGNEKKRKAQSAIEFMILVGAVMFFLTTFLIAVQISGADKERERRTFAVKEIALTVQDEINLALESSEGYSREFRIPDRVLNNVQYEIEIIEKEFVFVHTNDGKDAITLPIPDVEGDVNPGVNRIRKTDGKIYLNS